MSLSAAAPCPHCHRSSPVIPLNPREASRLSLLSCGPCDRTAWLAAGEHVSRQQALRLLAGKDDFAMAPAKSRSNPTKARSAA